MHIQDAWFVRVQLVKASTLEVVCVKVSEYDTRASTNTVYAHLLGVDPCSVCNKPMPHLQDCRGE